MPKDFDFLFHWRNRVASCAEGTGSDRWCCDRGGSVAAINVALPGLTQDWYLAAKRQPADKTVN